MNAWKLALASLLLLAACGSDEELDPSDLARDDLAIAEDGSLGDGDLPGKGISPVVRAQPDLAAQFTDAMARLDAAEGLDAVGSEVEQLAAEPIQYHGGPILWRPMNVYFVWYGNWGNAPARTLLPQFVNNLGGSARWRINTTYPDVLGRRVTESIRYAGGIDDRYSRGTRLRDTDVREILNAAFASGRLPRDPDATYWLLTTPDVEGISGFCTSWCAWHLSYYNYLDNERVPIRYGWIGGAARCWQCRPQERSPNRAPGADAMVFHLLRMLDKTSTDPDDNAWFAGAETGYKTRIGNADLCHWKFGRTHSAWNGSRFNVVLGNRAYLVAQNWVLTNPATGAGYCAPGF